MNAKAVLTNMMVKLGMDVKLETMKTADGNATIEAESFEPGEAVFIVTEDGNVPLPEGNYELEDGRVLVVADEGVISELGSAEEPAEEETEMEATPEYVTKAEFDELKQSIGMLVEKLSEQEKPAETEVEETKVEASKQEAAEEVEAEEEAEKAAEVELSAEVEAEVKPIKPNPDRETGKKQVTKIGSQRPQRTIDVVANALWS